MPNSELLAREALDRLCREQGIDYARLSGIIGRNPTYVQQYIKRGSPRRLAEQDRARIAAYLGVDEQILGARPPSLPPKIGTGRDQDMALIPKLAIGASAGPGNEVNSEAVQSAVAFDPRWLRDMGADPKALSIIRVEGDSMAPTLNDGDDILVDSSIDGVRLRDGIFVLRMDDALMVKRVARAPGQGRIAVISDNEHYKSWDDLPLSVIHLVGRVIWAGRRIR